MKGCHEILNLLRAYNNCHMFKKRLGWRTERDRERERERERENEWGMRVSMSKERLLYDKVQNDCLNVIHKSYRDLQYGGITLSKNEYCYGSKVGVICDLCTNVLWLWYTEYFYRLIFMPSSTPVQ